MNMPQSAPNKELAREKYKRLAGGYDSLGRIRLAESVRRQAVRLLALKQGDVVLDVACGTGLSFPHIQERIGPQGQLIGVDLSAEMLAKAREKVTQAGWRNVTLIYAAE